MENTNLNAKIGKLGENAACAYLLKLKWHILIRNHKEGSDEIDIIVKNRDRTLVFCEVKTLAEKLNNSTEWLRDLTPEDNLTSHKLRKISRACQIFAGKHSELIDEEKGWRIDLIAIDIGKDGKAKDIRHYENI